MFHNICYRKANRQGFLSKIASAIRTRLSQKLPMGHNICKMNLYQLQVTQLVLFETEGDNACK